MNVPKITNVGTLALTVSNDQAVGSTVKMAGFSQISVQLNSIAATTGALRLQQSLDNTNWEDIPNATSTLAASEANIAQANDVCAPFVRALVNITASAGNYTAFIFQK